MLAGWLLACAGEIGVPSDLGTPIPTGPAPCEAAPGLAIEAVEVRQPWSEHEAELVVTLSGAAAVAARCTLDGSPDEVHLVEGPRASAAHELRLAGLLAASTYQCEVAAVCPSSVAGPVEVQIQTDPPSNPLLPTLALRSRTGQAGRDYVLANHQRNGDWNGQRRLVMDRDANVRWYAHPDAGGTGGSAVGWSRASQSFTIGGGWPPNDHGRAQQIGLFGSGVRYDTLPHLPGEPATFHHEARELSDGRLLTLDEPRIVRPGGGTFRGFGVTIVDPATDAVDFAWTSQGAFDDGHLPGGGGDVYHANWANVYTIGAQEVLHVSLCAQGWTVAIDVPSGDWRWTFGRGGDFALVDVDGTPLSDDEFPQCQHGLQRNGDRLLVYDNGHQRANSRAVEYRLDEATMTATRLWEWTEPDWHETNLGGVDTTTVGVLVAMGHHELQTPNPGDLTTFVEIDPVSGEKWWEAQYTDVTDMAFRATAIGPCQIFANARYCAPVAERIEVLAVVFAP